MRDKNRIPEFIVKLTNLWMLFPDLRFGQLVADIVAYGEHSDGFYIEDEEMLAIIEEMIEAYYSTGKLP